MNVDNLINYFIKNGLEISDEQKLRGYFERKSIKRHKDIFDFLRSFNKVPLTEQHIHDFYRYDIKLRRFLFRYITPIEIHYRALAMNRCYQLSDKIENFSFGELLHEFYADNQRLDDIRNLRNEVMHFKLLQLCTKYNMVELIQSLYDEHLYLGFGHKFKRRLKDLLVSKGDKLKLINSYQIVDGNVRYGEML